MCPGRGGGGKGGARRATPHWAHLSLVITVALQLLDTDSHCMENLSHSLQAAVLGGEWAELEETSQLIIMF